MLKDACTIRRSHRKSLAIEVLQDGRVLVRAPFAAPEETIRRFVEAHADWIAAALERQRLHREAFPEPSPEEREQLIERARRILPERVRFYSARMGVQPAYVHITSAKTRFGSCNTKRGICFSWRLMRYPAEAIDYVVVHELAHLLHMDHSAAFYAAVAAVLPDYRERRALLRH